MKFVLAADEVAAGLKMVLRFNMHFLSDFFFVLN
jgi:hypothetical protein